MHRYTVKQLAVHARVSVRTLHHYDEIGLLKPAWIGDNSYRYYEQPQLDRLQKILMYRDLGMALEQIRPLLDASDADLADALRGHRRGLAERLRSLQDLLGVIETTLRRIDGDTPMTDTYPNIWQSEAKAAEYKQWLVERYSERIDSLMASVRRRITAMTPEERAGLKARREQLEGELAQAFRRGMTSGELASSDLLTRYRDWLATIWEEPATPAKYAGVANVYAGYKDYADHFNALAPGLTEWLVAGMKAWAALDVAA